MISVYLGIGGNIEREKHALAAWHALKEVASSLRASPIYECPALGFDSLPFFNWVVELETELNLVALQQCLRDIEYRYGRSKHAVKFEDRTLDIDILLYGDWVTNEPIRLPREDVFRYPFVIQPLYDLAPELVIPGDERTVADVWRTLGPFDELTPVALPFPM